MLKPVIEGGGHLHGSWQVIRSHTSTNDIHEWIRVLASYRSRRLYRTHNIAMFSLCLSDTGGCITKYRKGFAFKLFLKLSESAKCFFQFPRIRICHCDMP